jgi:hypothetical protein
MPAKTKQVTRFGPTRGGRQSLGGRSSLGGNSSTATTPASARARFSTGAKSVPKRGSGGGKRLPSGRTSLRKCALVVFCALFQFSG